MSIKRKKNTKTKTVETLTHPDDKRPNIPTAELQPVMEDDEPSPGHLRAQPRPRSPIRVAGQGRTGLVGSGGAGAAAFYSGKGASEGID